MSEARGSGSRRSGVVGWIADHPKSSIALCLLLLLIGVVVVFNQAAQGRVARRIAALRAAGMPTTIEDLQAAMPQIPDDQNMTIPILEQAYVLGQIKFSEEIGLSLPYVGVGRTSPSGCRLPPEQLEAVRWYLDQAAGALPIIHEALKLERGCVDVQWKSPAVNVILPELSKFRYVAKVLALEALLAAEEGDSERAAGILLDLCRLDRAQECETFLIGALVRIAINALADDQIERTINLCGLSEATLGRLQAAVRDQERADYFKEGLIAERVIFLDTIGWLRSGKGSGAPALSAGPVSPAVAYWKYVPILPSMDEAAGIKLYDELILAVGDPDATTIANVKKVELRSAAMPSYYVMTRTLRFSILRATEIWVRHVAQNLALQAAIACERYRLATGRWPETLDALVPDYLAAVPVDPFDGKPMRYAHIAEGIKVWSISDNLVDDGGDVGRLAVRQRSNRSKDSGWVLLNPDLRGRPAESNKDRAK